MMSEHQDIVQQMVADASASGEPVTRVDVLRAIEEKEYENVQAESEQTDNND